VTVAVLSHPHGATVGDRLIVELHSGAWDEFRCAVAFAKVSGVRYIDGPIRAFVAAGKRAVVAVGVDHGGTSFEAASHLAGAVQANGELIVVKDVASPPATFHPKVYVLLERAPGGPIERALLISGSSNLTEGGLFTNHELSTAWSPDLTDMAQAAAFAAAMHALDAWQDTSSGLSVVGDAPKLLELHGAGLLPTESAMAAARAASGAVTRAGTTPPGTLSGLRRVSSPDRSAAPRSGS
jgi:HKD family nuclease